MIKNISKFAFSIMLGIQLFSSCDELTDINLPIDQLATDAVFSDSLTVRSAINGLYAYNLMTSGYIYAIPLYLSVISDDAYHNSQSYIIYNENSYSPTTSAIENYWKNPYTSIYMSNSLITRLTETTLISKAEADIAIAEAKYFRAYNYWILVNYFGDVPLVLSTNYAETAQQSREDKNVVYEQIVQDLKDAEAIMGQSKNDNTKVTEAAVKALLARVYLYMGRWAEAEAKANEVITQYKFELEPLSDVFLRASKETIFKATQDYSTYKGRTYWGYICLRKNFSYLRNELQDAFESDDQRKTEWTKARTAAGDKLPDGTMPVQSYKYKQATSPSDASLAEDYVLLRLGEQYLIRAEARAQQGTLTGANGAISDLNVIRKRAGLDDLSESLSKEQVILAVEQERRVELFMEETHRWFDLKRTNRIDVFMSAIPEKKWSSHKALFPVPDREIVRNRNLTPNPGYGSLQ